MHEKNFFFQLFVSFCSYCFIERYISLKRKMIAIRSCPNFSQTSSRPSNKTNNQRKDKQKQVSFKRSLICKKKRSIFRDYWPVRISGDKFFAVFINEKIGLCMLISPSWAKVSLKCSD